MDARQADAATLFDFVSELQVAELALEVGISKWYLSRLVRNQTGQRLSTLVMIVRLLKAVSLIEAGRLSVKEVAAKAGFSSTSDMDRQFRRWLHVRPREFRHFASGISRPAS